MAFIKFYRSLELKWYQEFTLILAAFFTNGFTMHVNILQDEMLKMSVGQVSKVVWTFGVYVMLVVIYVSVRDALLKKEVSK